MSVQSLPSGGSVWGLVKAANPKATNAELNQKTEQVLKANNLTWNSAKTLKAGTKIDLGVLDAKAKESTTTKTNTKDSKPASATNTESNDLASMAKKLLESLPADVLNQPLGNLASSSQTNSVPSFWSQLGLTSTQQSNPFNFSNMDQLLVGLNQKNASTQRALTLANLNPYSMQGSMNDLLKGLNI